MFSTQLMVSLAHEVPMFSSTYAWVRSVNVTVPDGLPVLGAVGVTFAVNVTFWPYTDDGTDDPTRDHRTG